ncbi:hypothetical protein PybrP1_005765 [[Pythium] brassicae (nom. inval.)]|nr:hypothetical protein PybrP1_005765 [[Pythium] brassicae (nom. inval.)]
MGNVCCGGGSDAELLQRQQLLKDGAEFTRQAPFLGGVLRRAERIHLQLSPSATRLQWRQATGSNRTEEIAVSRVARVCVNGPAELLLLAANGQKLLELTAESTATRDLWAQTLEEICFSASVKSTEEDAKALQLELAKQEEKRREVGFGKYWKDRTSELEQRKADAEERKKSIGLSGMKFTAQAMARR